MKKKKRLAALKQQQEDKPKQEGILGVADCDIGASPQMSKGSMLSKQLGYGKASPI